MYCKSVGGKEQCQISALNSTQRKKGLSGTYACSKIFNMFCLVLVTYSIYCLKTVFTISCNYSLIIEVKPSFLYFLLVVGVGQCLLNE